MRLLHLVEENKCYFDDVNSFLHQLVSGKFRVSILSAIIHAIITAVVLRMFFDMKCRRKKR